LQKGVSSLHPIRAFFWFVLLAANIAAPPSLNLVREVFICVRVLKLGVWLAVVIGLITFMSAVYNLYLYSSQQGNASSFLWSRGVISSSFLLSCLLHSVPVYLSVLGLFCFYVWKNSLILKCLIVT
jgi:NADH-ubiquinone oxidoreductase chain 4